MMRNVIGGTWRIDTTWGTQYEVEITEVSDHKGLSFSGRFVYNGECHGIGCFPFEKIRKMERIKGVDILKKCDIM